MIATFFSYKGGVGRSMAVANVAADLTNRHGYRVLVVDWDLEAPGLHYYFGLTDHDLRSKSALLDMLTQPDLLDGEFNLDPFISAPSPAVASRIKHGSLHLLTCGRLDRSYRSRVSGYNWAKYYKDGGNARFDRLKGKFASSYDFCLIDARAGQTDTNVAATGQLADLLVMLFTSNDQSMSGTAQMSRSLRAVYRDRPGSPDVPIVLAPSRVFNEEPEYKEWVETVATPVFNELVDANILSLRYQPRGIEHFALAIHSPSSIREQLPVLDDPDGSLPLVQGYRALVKLLIERKRGETVLWHALRLAGEPAVASESEARLREEIQLALKRGDQVGIAFAELRLAQLLNATRPEQLAEAQALAESALAVLDRHGDSDFKAPANHTMGRIATAAGDHGQARQRYLDALASLASDRKEERAILLHDLGIVHVALGEYEQAEAALTAALAVRRELKDTRGQASTLVELGNLELARMGNPAVAHDRFGTAFSRFESCSDLHGVALSGVGLGEAFAAEENWTEAMWWFNRSARIYDQIGNVRLAGIARQRAGDAQVGWGQLEEAAKSYKSALADARAARVVHDEQKIRRRLAQTQLRLDKLAEAKEEATIARRLSVHAELVSETIRNLLLLAEIEAALNDDEALERHLAEAERLAAGTGEVADMELCRVARTRISVR